MKNVQKFLCILLASVMICMTPMAEYVNINQIKTVEAAEPITTTLLLEFILAACGVTVAANALDNAADAFEDWLGNNGSDDAINNWNAAKTMGIISISAPLITSVMAWIGEKFGDLNSGSVVSANLNYSFYNSFFSSALSQRSFDKYYTDLSVNPYFVVFSRTVEKPYSQGTFPCGEAYGLGRTNPCITVVRNKSGTLYSYVYIYDIDSGYMSRYVFRNQYLTTEGDSPEFFEGTVNTSYFPGDITKEGFFSNSPIIYVSMDSSPSTGLYIDDLIPYMTDSFGLDFIVDAFTSYGDYDSANISNLAGLSLSPAIIAAIMAGVNDAISSNQEDVAKAIADAYAKGLEDAKAQQGELEDEAKEQEKINTLTGWMAKILDAITSVPLTIFQLFATVLTDGFGIVSSVFDTTVEIKDLITSIPMTLAECFVEVFPSAQYVGELITSIPASIVDALIEVFPASEQLFEWITSIPATIVDAIGIGVGTLTDGLTAVKEAVLAIPGAIADAIAIALAALFTPDIDVVEPQLKEIEDNLLWIEDVKDIVDDMRSELKAGEPPVLYLDFTKAEDSKYHGAGRCLAIDFSWYAKYKATGDLVFGAFLWIIYIWYLFKRFPDIISGAGFVTRESINSHNRAAADARQSELNKAGVVGRVKIIDHRGGK